MGLTGQFKEDADTLEKLNLMQHDRYSERGELMVMDAKDSAKAFAANKVLDSVVSKALEEKDKIMKDADAMFAGNDNLKTSSSSSGLGTSKATASSTSTSKSSAWAPNRSSAWGSNKSSRDNVDDRVAKMMKKAMEIAEEEDDGSSSRRRRKKRTILDKMAPRHSKRRKAFVVFGVIAVESVMTILVITQQTAKAEIASRRDKV